jgi:hypothetical protein
VSRKVFSGKEGMDIVDAASMFGVTPRELLQVLSTVPNRGEYSVLLSKENTEALEKKGQSNDSFNKSATAKAYDKLTVSYLNTARKIQSKFAEITKGIKIPYKSEMVSKARDFVSKMKIKDLSSNQWVVGERNSVKLANAAADMSIKLENILKAAQNTQFAKEVRIATGKVNSATNFLASLVSDGAKYTLNAAGANYTGAIKALSFTL